MYCPNHLISETIYSLPTHVLLLTNTLSIHFLVSLTTLLHTLVAPCYVLTFLFFCTLMDLFFTFINIYKYQFHMNCLPKYMSCPYLYPPVMIIF